MITLILFTSLFDGKRSLDGKLLLTLLACPFSSLRLLEEKTREPISGEKTRAQHSRAGQEFIAPASARHQKYLPLEDEAAEEGTEAAAGDDEAETEPGPHPVWELF